MGIRECNPPRTLSGASDPSRIVLDEDHPVVEQEVKVHIPAQALPDRARADSVTLDIEPVTPPPVPADSRPSAIPSHASPPQGGSLGAGSIRLAFVQSDTGEVVARVRPNGEGRDASFRDTLAGIKLDCEPAADCDRSFRIVASIGRGVTGQADLTWKVRATVDWGFDGCNGPPYTATPDVAVAEPVRGRATALAEGELPIQSGRGLILARHVTVSTEAAPGLAYGQLLVRRTGKVAWTPWLRVLADEPSDRGRDTLVLDAPLGERYGAGPVEQLADFPILSSCDPGAACRRGYWVIIQAVPAGRFGRNVAWAPGLDVGAIEWELAAVGSSAHSSGAPASISLAVDDEPADLAPRPVLETDQVRFELDADVERFVEVALHVPAAADGNSSTPGWWRAAAVVASVRGFGVAHGYRLEGPGAGPFVGGGSGDSTLSLIAHPFDGCVPGAACDVSLRMVGILNPDPHTSMSGTPNVTFRLAVLGAPAGTTASIGSTGERPRSTAVNDSSEGGWPPVPLLAAVLVGASLAAILFVRSLVGRSRRRGPGQP